MKQGKNNVVIAVDQAESAPIDWQLQKTKRGRPRSLKSPRHLWELACDYFTWMDQTPIIINEVMKGGDLQGKIIGVPASRPYTWQGLENYIYRCGVQVTLTNYRLNRGEVYGEYTETVERIGSIMFSQKFEGAAVGIFKEGLISRELGLVDKTEVDNLRPAVVAPQISIYNNAPPLADSEDNVIE